MPRRSAGCTSIFSCRTGRSRRPLPAGRPPSQWRSPRRFPPLGRSSVHRLRPFCALLPRPRRSLLVEDHEQRRQALRVDQPEDLDVATRRLAPLGRLERPFRLGEEAVIADGPLVAARVFGLQPPLLAPLLADFAEVGIAGMALFLL